MRNIYRALRFFRSDVPRMTVVMLLLVAGIMANLLKPWPLAIIVDLVLGPHRRVDKILTLQDGRLVEDGSPLELLQHPGYYARVVNGQISLE